MGLLELASGNSFWRGYDYFKESRVKSYKKIEPNLYEGSVEGGEGAIYSVTIDLDHPKKSQCNCLHAEGNRRICKHKVALYFAVFPETANKAIEDAKAWEAEEERREEKERKEIEKYVYSLSKQELREQLLWRMLDERSRRNYW